MGWPILLKNAKQRLGIHSGPELLDFYRCFRATLRASLALRHFLAAKKARALAPSGAALSRCRRCGSAGIAGSVQSCWRRRLWQIWQASSTDRSPYGNEVATTVRSFPC